MNNRLRINGGIMIEDNDLDFLKQCTNQDLDNLVRILIYDNDDKNRVSETLTKCDGYKNHYPNHLKYYEEIVSELQCYGGNTIANIFRGGKGVLYREILEDVCDKYKIKYDKTIETESLETLLLLTIVEHSMDKMNDSQRKELLNTLNVSANNLSKQAVMSAIQIAIQTSGFASYRISVVVADAILKQMTGHGIALVGNQVLMKSLNVLSGPIGWGITSLWALYDITGPAYRVTIPAVIEIAYLRQEYIKREKSIVKSSLYKIKKFFKNGNKL